MRKIIHFIPLLMLGVISACGNQTAISLTGTLLPPTVTNTTTHTPLPPTSTFAPTVTSIPILNLLYAADSNVNIYDIYTGKNLSLLQNLEKIGEWSLSPDAKRLVYQLQPPLDDATYLLDLTMKQTREIHSYSPLSILWHPSGQAFLSYNTNTGNYELFRLADGAVVAEALEPGSFSPDGAKLAAYEGQELRIYDIRLDANGDVIGVNGKYSKYQLPLDEDIIMSSILWSPQGDRLAFSAQKSWDYPTSFIYSIKQDGSDLIKLVDSKILEPEKLTEIRSEAGTPHGAHIYYGWSPNGTKVAFLAYTFLPKEKYIVEPQVYVVDADGTELMKITGDEFFPEGDDLLWVPDGRLLFQAGNKLILSNADGSEKKALSENIYIIYAFFLPPSADEYLAGIFAKPFAFNCATGWARMEIGIEAIVAPGSPNRVRSEPKKGDNLIASLLAGTIVNIIEGPVCADGLIFWKVENELISGGVGWTAEGDGNEYWLEPIK